MKALVGLVIISAIPNTADLIESAGGDQFPRIEFEMSKDESGALLALRRMGSAPGSQSPQAPEHRKLLKESRSRHRGLDELLACYDQECVKINGNWSFFATSPERWGAQKIILIYGGSMATRQFALKPCAFQSQKPTPLRLPSTVLKAVVEQQHLIERDRARNRKVFQNISNLILPSKWGLPIQSALISSFGSPRFPPDGQAYAHSGADLKAAQGTVVSAAADGVVADISEQVLGGKTIIVDHGQGIMTRYLHLSEFGIKIGQQVKKGEKIGLSGATGRVEAPHLHWEMRVRSRPVDPLSGSHLLARLLGSK